jgi:hypothetical protein
MRHHLEVIFVWLVATMCTAMGVAQDAALSRGQSASTKAFEGARRVATPGAITDVIPARRGQILALVLAKEKQVALFDCRALEIIGSIPLSSSSVMVAGTLDHLIVVDRIGSTIEQWSLDTFEREVSKKSPFRGEIVSLGAGSASQGPFLLRHRIVKKNQQTAAVFAALELHTFARSQVGIAYTASADSAANKTAHLICRASPNGQAFTMWHPSDYMDGIFRIRRVGKNLQADYQVLSCGYALPSADGEFIFTGFRGVTSDGKIAPSDAQRLYQSCVPTSHSQFYLITPSAIEASKSKEEMAGKDRPRLVEMGSTAPLVSLPKIEFDTGAYLKKSARTVDAAAYWIEHRLFYYLPANLVIAIPYSDDCLLLHSFNLAQELEKTKSECIYVSSLPQLDFEPGQEYRYQVEVESNSPQITYELRSGPIGMTISHEGLISWEVPANFDKPSTEVSISVTNGSNRKSFDNFTLFLSRE